MTKQSPLEELLQNLLAEAGKGKEIKPFLDAVLPEIRSVLGVRSMAVVRSSTPQWQVLACSGVRQQQVATELAAEALDRQATAREAQLVAGPLGDRCALLVEGELDSNLWESLRESLAAAMQLVRSGQQSVRRAHRLETILEITHAWGQTNCMETLLQAMAQAATQLLGADRASIFLWDKAGKLLVAKPALGMEGEELRIPDDTGIVGQVIQTGEVRRVGAGRDEDQISRSVDKETGYSTETVLCVPLNSPQGKRLGAFEVLNKHEGRFTEEDEQGLIELALHAAVALENTQQFEELFSKHQRLVDEAAEGVQLIGNSPAIEALRSTIGRIADTDLAILVLGENGTGKEVVAQSIHYLSSRREQPFIAVNCAALTESLLESELFGHEKGAFTDAHETRVGKFELASGGTLFLDEIGDMSLAGQAKLLRVLEEKTVVRVGGSQLIHTGVRILAATNQDLATMVREKRFREDLFFRLNVVSLELPPLRERGEDMMLLAQHFLAGFCQNMGRTTPEFSATATKRLLEHPWPGNVRELRNLMERLAYLSSGDRIETDDLAFINAGVASRSIVLDTRFTLNDATQDFQQKYIRQMIESAGGNMSSAAKQLGMHRSNLYRKMRQLGMGPGEEPE